MQRRKESEIEKKYNEDKICVPIDMSCENSHVKKRGKARERSRE